MPYNCDIQKYILKIDTDDYVEIRKAEDIAKHPSALPRIDAQALAGGSSMYTADRPALSNEVHAAFVLSAKIGKVDKISVSSDVHLILPDDLDIHKFKNTYTPFAQSGLSVEFGKRSYCPELLAHFSGEEKSDANLDPLLAREPEFVGQAIASVVGANR